MAYAEYGQAMLVVCPKCNAAIDKPCTGPSGAAMSTPHKDRKEMARNVTNSPSESKAPETAPIEGAVLIRNDKEMAKAMTDWADRLREQAATLNTRADALDMTADVIKEKVGA